MKYNHACENKECKNKFTNYKARARFCCMLCRSRALTKTVVCDNCKKEKRKPLSDIFEKSKNNFCGVSCKNLFYTGNRSNLHNMGGRYVTESTGMTYVWCEVKYRAEHRVFTEAFIGRALLRGEPILHINGCNSDNKIDNLYVCSSLSEMSHILKSYDIPYPYKSNLNQLRHQNEQANKKD